MVHPDDHDPRFGPLYDPLREPPSIDSLAEYRAAVDAFRWIRVNYLAWGRRPRTRPTDGGYNFLIMHSYERLLTQISRDIIDYERRHRGRWSPGFDDRYP